MNRLDWPALSFAPVNLWSFPAAWKLLADDTPDDSAPSGAMNPDSGDSARTPVAHA